MPGMNGLEVLQAVRRIDPQALVIIITAYASVESAIEAMKIGAPSTTSRSRSSTTSCC